MADININPKVIEAIPLSVQEQIPAATPPPGIVPNFEHPISRVPEIVGVGSVFLGLALVWWSIRVYTKTTILKRWSWDDWTLTGGFALSIIIWGFIINGCVEGATGRHQWEVHINRAINGPAFLQGYVSIILSQPSFALIKGSFYIQYYILFRRLRWMRIAIWTGASIHTILYGLATVSAFVLCSPWHGETLFETNLSWHYLEFANLSVPIGAVGLVDDLYLFCLPIPAVMGLHMTTAKKFGLIAVFTTGGLAVAASAVSLAYRIRLQNNFSDATWNLGYLYMWNQIELLVGVTVACMPSVKHFFKHLSHQPWAQTLKSDLSRTLLHKSSQKTQSSESSNGNPHIPGGNRSDNSDTNKEDIVSTAFVENLQNREKKDISVIQNEV